MYSNISFEGDPALAAAALDEATLLADVVRNMKTQAGLASLKMAFPLKGGGEVWVEDLEYVRNVHLIVYGGEFSSRRDVVEDTRKRYELLAIGLVDRANDPWDPLTRAPDNYRWGNPPLSATSAPRIAKHRPLAEHPGTLDWSDRRPDGAFRGYVLSWWFPTGIRQSEVYFDFFEVPAAPRSTLARTVYCNAVPIITLPEGVWVQCACLSSRGEGSEKINYLYVVYIADDDGGSFVADNEHKCIRVPFRAVAEEIFACDPEEIEPMWTKDFDYSELKFCNSSGTKACVILHNGAGYLQPHTSAFTEVVGEVDMDSGEITRAGPQLQTDRQHTSSYELEDETPFNTLPNTPPPPPALAYPSRWQVHKKYTGTYSYSGTGYEVDVFDADYEGDELVFVYSQVRTVLSSSAEVNIDYKRIHRWSSEDVSLDYIQTGVGTDNGSKVQVIGHSKYGVFHTISSSWQRSINMERIVKVRFDGDVNLSGPDSSHLQNLTYENTFQESRSTDGKRNPTTPRFINFWGDLRAGWYECAFERFLSPDTQSFSIESELKLTARVSLNNVGFAITNGLHPTPNTSLSIPLNATVADFHEQGSGSQNNSRVVHISMYRGEQKGYRESSTMFRGSWPMNQKVDYVDNLNQMPFIASRSVVTVSSGTNALPTWGGYDFQRIWDSPDTLIRERQPANFWPAPDRSAHHGFGGFRISFGIDTLRDTDNIPILIPASSTSSPDGGVLCHSLIQGSGFEPPGLTEMIHAESWVKYPLHEQLSELVESVPDPIWTNILFLGPYRDDDAGKYEDSPPRGYAPPPQE